MKSKWIVALFVAGAMLSQAQGPLGGRAGRFAFGAASGAPGGQRSLNALKTYLNLSDAQVQQLQQVPLQNRTAPSRVLQQLRPKQQAEDTLLASSAPDLTAVGNAYLAVENLRQQMKQSRDGAHQSALAVLTAAQQAQLQALSDAEKLLPAIGQASALGLLTPPAGGPGMRGPGMMYRRGARR